MKWTHTHSSVNHATTVITITITSCRSQLWSASSMSQTLARIKQALKWSSTDFDSNLIHHGLFHEFDSLWSELASATTFRHSDTQLDLHPESQYLGEPTSVHITEAVHQAQHKPLPSTQSKSERGSSLPPVVQLHTKQVTFPFESDSDSSYTLPDQSDPEIVFWRQPSRLETLNILIEELQSFSQGDTTQTSEQFQSAIDPDDQYIDDTFADHSKMANDSEAYDTSANRDQFQHRALKQLWYSCQYQLQHDWWCE